MASSLHPLLISILISDLSLPSSSFNFEPRLPLVKRGPPDSYFGFSVAQHQVTDDTRKIVSKNL